MGRGDFSKFLPCLMLALSLVGCGQASPQPTPRPAPTSQRGPADEGLSPALGGQAVSLVNAFALENLSLVAVRERVVQRIADCMREDGFRYLDPGSPVVIGLQGSSLSQLLRLAGSRGYGFASAARTQLSAAGPPTDPNLRYLEGMSASGRREFWLALTGRPEAGQDQVVLPREVPMTGQGCQKRSISAVLSQLPFFTAGIDTTIRAFISGESTSAPLAQAERKWSACMRSQGYRVVHYDDALQHYQSHIGGLPPAQVVQAGSSERRLASADANCYLTAIHPVQRQVETVFLKGLARQYSSYHGTVERTLATW
jgi:hypothetical protein